MSFIREHKVALMILCSAVFIGAFLRLWNLDLWLHFARDEVRDIAVMRSAWETGTPSLIGPEVKHTGFFYGPTYYMLLMLPNVLTDFAPSTSAYLIAIFGIISIPLVFAVGKMYFGTIAGLTASVLYSIAPMVVHHSRWGWNPNLLPFIVLLTMLVLAGLRRTTDPTLTRLFILALGVCAGVSIQLHLSALAIFPFIGISWLLLGIPRPKAIDALISFGVGIVLINGIPFLGMIYERGGYVQNVSAVLQAHDVSAIQVRLFEIIPYAWTLMFQNMVLPGVPLLGASIGFIVLMVLFLTYAVRTNEQKRLSWVFVTFFATFIAGLAFSEMVLDYYFIYLLPFPFLVVGAITQRVVENMRHIRWLVYIPALCIGILLCVRLTSYFIHLDQGAPDEYLVTKETMHEVISYVGQQSGGNLFSLDVVPDFDYQDAYHYLLMQRGAKLPIDTADQVFLLIHPSSRLVNFFPEINAYTQQSDINIGSVRVVHLIKD